MSIETEEYRGYTIDIEQDEYPYNPRQDDNFGTLVLSHKRYDLPHEADIEPPHQTTWEALARYLRRYYDAALVLPVWGYDHSGLYMKAGELPRPFADGHYWQHYAWDSGLLGFIFVTREKMLEEFEAITDETLQRAEAVLIGEVETYNAYSIGAVYGYIVSDPDGNECDDGSVWGYYDSDDALRDARGFVDYQIREIEQCDQMVRDCYAL